MIIREEQAGDRDEIARVTAKAFAAVAIKLSRRS